LADEQAPIETPGHVGAWTRALIGDSSTDLLGDTIPPSIKQELEWSVSFDTLMGAESASNNVTSMGIGGTNEETALLVGDGESEKGEGLENDDADGVEVADADGEEMGDAAGVDLDWLNNLLEWTVQQPVEN
jgi:hypothetical protein